MKRNIPLKLKLTTISVCILTVMCAAFAISMIFSSNGLVKKAALATPAMVVGQELPTISANKEVTAIPLEPSVAVTEALWQFRGTTVLVMLCLIVTGSALTYLFASKALKPLEDLTQRVQHIDIHNLGEGISISRTKDEVAKLAEAFQSMTEKLNLSYQVQKNFSANAAHELRTPLAAIQTQLDVFQMKSDRNVEEYNSLLQSVQESVDRLSNLVKDLLTFTNEQELGKKEMVELRALLEEITFELEERAAAKQVNITISGEGTVLGDDSLLQRAFYNLISNAIRYNVDGGSIEIKITDHKVIIADTGIGIPDEAKSHVFDIFFCVDKSRSRELGGSGLGLAIVKNIIEKHDGYIDVKDNQPQGSIFIVCFDKSV